MKARHYLIAGILFMLLAVALGAFGAHALKAMLSAHQIEIWKTATDYQTYHALGLIGLALWGQQQEFSRLASTAGNLFIGGIVFFCGSLYLLALTGIGKFGMITPIGGLFFLAGWVLWLVSVIKSRD